MVLNKKIKEKEVATTIKRKYIRKKPLKKNLEKERDTSFTLSRPISNPLISPKWENKWESWQTFNPAAILLEDKIHFLYRAIGDDGVSRFGYAMSEDGFLIKKRLPYPVYQHQTKAGPHFCNNYPSGGSWSGCEDPRLVRVEKEDKIYITYTACDGGLGVGLSSIKIKDFINNNWNWKTPKIISKPGEVHKNWLIFPKKFNNKYAIIHSISPEILIEYLDDLEFKNKKYIESFYSPAKVEKERWDSKVRGVGPPPIETKDGWLLLYHAEDRRDPGKYKIGALILDKNDPRKILYRSKQPILEPKEYYELEGYKPGVVYALGAVIKNNKFIVYYGGADNYVCVAFTEINNFLENLKKGEKSKFDVLTLKKKTNKK